MQKYLDQLIEDLRKATLQVKAPHDIWYDIDISDEEEMEDMSYAEKFIYGQTTPVEQITGIEAIMLPPPELLTHKQQTLLVAELERLLNIKHFVLDFPSNYPLHLRYPFIRNFWHSQQVEISFGTSHIEFCNYDISSCPFPGYCNSCKECDEED